MRIIGRTARLRGLALRGLLRLLRLLPLRIVASSIGLALAVTLRILWILWILRILLILLIRLALRWPLWSWARTPWSAIPAWPTTAVAPAPRYFERQQG